MPFVPETFSTDQRAGVRWAQLRALEGQRLDMEANIAQNPANHPDRPQLTARLAEIDNAIRRFRAAYAKDLARARVLQQEGARTLGDAKTRPRPRGAR